MAYGQQKDIIIGRSWPKDTKFKESILYCFCFVTFEVFGDVTPCSLVEIYRRLGEAYCLQLQDLKSKTRKKTSNHNYSDFRLPYCFLGLLVEPENSVNIRILISCYSLCWELGQLSYSSDWVVD
jgi:hypothetical protein